MKIYAHSDRVTTKPPASKHHQELPSTNPSSSQQVNQRMFSQIETKETLGQLSGSGDADMYIEMAWPYNFALVLAG